MKPFTYFLLLGSCFLACAGEPTGSSTGAIDNVCNNEAAAASVDGIPAYEYCGNYNVWSNNGVDTQTTSGGAGWVETEPQLGYQCVEFAVRYSHFKFGVSTNWTIGAAKDMCASHPAELTVTTTPVHGDLMVFDASSCGADPVTGHVAVVDLAYGTSVKVVQEHPASTYGFQNSCASCFLHAAANTAVPDAGDDAASADASADAADDGGTVTPPTSKGCGCSVTGAPSTQRAWLLAAFALAWFGVRRSRQKSRPIT